MKNSNPKNKVTLDSLAGMVKKGFDSVDKNFEENRQGHKKMNKRLDNIELLLSIKYQRRIEILEKKVKRVEELLAVR